MARLSGHLFGFPSDPDILKTVCVVNLLSVVNLLRVVIRYEGWGVAPPI